MDVFVFFFIIMILIYIPVIINTIRNYNNMINDKFMYLKTKISNLENEFKAYKKQTKHKKQTKQTKQTKHKKQK